MFRRILIAIAGAFSAWEACDLFGLQHYLYGYDCRNVVMGAVILLLVLLMIKRAWKEYWLSHGRKHEKRYNPFE